MSGARRGVIAGTGCSLPERVVTNADLEKMVDTSDEWITTRTGIRERRGAGEGGGVWRSAPAAAPHARGMAGGSRAAARSRPWRPRTPARSPDHHDTEAPTDHR